MYSWHPAQSDNNSHTSFFAQLVDRGKPLVVGSDTDLERVNA